MEVLAPLGGTTQPGLCLRKRDPRMARLAQRLEVVIGVIAAVGNRTNVMNLGRGDETISR